MVSLGCASSGYRKFAVPRNWLVAGSVEMAVIAKSVIFIPGLILFKDRFSDAEMDFVIVHGSNRDSSVTQ